MRHSTLMGGLCLFTGLACGCNRQPANEERAGGVPSSPAQGAASAQVAPLTSATPLSGLDPCLVGRWTGTGVRLNVDKLSASGGANLTLQVAPSGASVLDFSGMAPVVGKTAGMSFDFHYVGQAQATLSTPARGTLAGSDANYGGVRVTANMDLQKEKKMQIFKDKPLSELAALGTAIASAVGPKGKAAPAPTSGASAPGIDAKPVFSNNRYTCDAANLKLSGGGQATEWLFTRATP